MKKLKMTRTALRELLEIIHYIAIDSPQASLQVRDDLQAAMNLLREFPRAGHRRADCKIRSYRFWRIHSYLIAYRVAGNTVIITRLIHGAQNFRKALRSRN